MIEQIMTTVYGTRHKVGSASPLMRDDHGTSYRLLVASCNITAAAYSHKQPRSTKICTRCFRDFIIAEQP